MIGKTVTPTLEAIEQALWEWDAQEMPVRPNYPIEGFRAALKIFMHVMMDRMFEEQNFDDMRLEQRMEMGAKLGEDIKKLVFTYTGVDTFELYKEKKKAVEDSLHFGYGL